MATADRAQSHDQDDATQLLELVARDVTHAATEDTQPLLPELAAIVMTAPLELVTTEADSPAARRRQVLERLAAFRAGPEADTLLWLDYAATLPDQMRATVDHSLATTQAGLDLARVHPVAGRLLEIRQASSRAVELKRLHSAARALSGGAMSAWTYPWEGGPGIGAVDAPALLGMHALIVQGGATEDYADQVLATVRRLMGYMDAEGLLALGVYSRAARLKPTAVKGDPAGRALDPWELEALLGAAAGDPQAERGARDAALLAVLYGAGLRRSEALGLDVADIHMDRTPAQVRVRLGKGRKARTVDVLPGWDEALVRWLEIRTAAGLPAAGALLVNVTVDGGLTPRRMSAEALTTTLDRLVAHAQLAMMAGTAWPALAAHRGTIANATCPGHHNGTQAKVMMRRDGRPVWSCWCGRHAVANEDGTVAIHGGAARWATVAGGRAPAPLTAHDLRRSFITHLLDEGVALDVVAHLAGHSSIQTTSLYNRNKATQATAAVGALPRMRWPEALPVDIM